MAKNDDTNPDLVDSAATTKSASRDSAAASTPTTERATTRLGAPQALAITGIAAGAALLLGLTFAGGTALGRELPDGPGGQGGQGGQGGPGGQGGNSAMGPHGDRGEIVERMGDRMDQRAENRDQRADNRDERRAQFEQWLEEQGIDPSTIPGPPMPGGPTE